MLIIDTLHFLGWWNIRSPAREICIQGEGDGIACAVVTIYGLACLLIAKKCFPIQQQPNLQLVDNCTRRIVTFPLCRDFPGPAVLA